MCRCVSAETEWTEWFNRDTERGSGDWEKLSDLHEAFPERLCSSPMDMQVLQPLGSNSLILFLANIQYILSVFYHCFDHINGNLWVNCEPYALTQLKDARGLQKTNTLSHTDTEINSNAPSCVQGAFRSVSCFIQMLLSIHFTDVQTLVFSVGCIRKDYDRCFNKWITNYLAALWK